MNRIEKERAREEALRQELRYAIEDAAIGERLDAALLGRVKTVARAILLRHGLKTAQLHAALVAEGLQVHITLPKTGPRVGVIHLSFGGDTFAGL